MVTSRDPLTAEDRRRVDVAVAALERRTSAVFALAIVSVSDRYALFPMVWSALIALAATGVLALLRPDLGIADGFLVDAALFAALALALDWLPLRLRLVPRRIKHAHARQLAHREFAARILASAQHRNGVLFFVSLSERYVEVIADRDIHARVPEGTWDKIVADFIAAVRSDRPAEGFIAAIEACGAVLETHYPVEKARP
jgi:putative membrane protein